MRGHFYIGFNDFKSNNKILIDFTGPFSPNGFKENDEKKNAIMISIVVIFCK